MWTEIVILQTIALGIGATIMMDLYAFCMAKLFNIPPLNYGLVGRWFIHIWKGKISHQTIMATPQVVGENSIGWFLHYLIGVIFAFVFIAMVGAIWFVETGWIAPILFGLCTVVFPFFLMQPCFGFGVAASRTPQPNTVRMRSLMAHCSFGVGLYLIGLLISRFY